MRRAAATRRKRSQSLHFCDAYRLTGLQANPPPSPSSQSLSSSFFLSTDGSRPATIEGQSECYPPDLYGCASTSPDQLPPYQLPSAAVQRICSFFPVIMDAKQYRDLVKVFPQLCQWSTYLEPRSLQLQTHQEIFEFWQTMAELSTEPHVS